MAVRKEVKVKRGCGFRKVGGLYLVGPPFGRVCDRLPYRLLPCPVCGKLHKFNRGISKVTGFEVFHYNHETQLENARNLALTKVRYCQEAKEAEAATAKALEMKDVCECPRGCPVCNPEKQTAGLMWVGKKFYTPESFTKEAESMGVSKRIPYMPDWLKVGDTWVFLAHPEACEALNQVGENGGEQGKLITRVPGIFQAFIPQRVEKTVTESEAAEHLPQETIDMLDAQGVDVCTVPDNDPDHR